jgi:hypothetical protein
VLFLALLGGLLLAAALAVPHYLRGNRSPAQAVRAS